MYCVSLAALSVNCSLVVTCWKRANLLALMYVIFSCIFVTFPCAVLGQVIDCIKWYLIVSIPDLCILPYFRLDKYSKVSRWFGSVPLIRVKLSVASMHVYWLLMHKQ